MTTQLDPNAEVRLLNNLQIGQQVAVRQHLVAMQRLYLDTAI